MRMDFMEDSGILTNINDLPDEILIYIFKHLPLASLMECVSVCQRWRKLFMDPSIWRRIEILYSGKMGQIEMFQRNLQIITTHAECIQRLKLQYVKYPFIKPILEKCDNLTSLQLVMCTISKEFEDDIKRWPDLKLLNLRNSLLASTKEDLFIQYDQFKKLNFLSLADFGLSPTNCDSLLNCENLTHILIEKIRDLSYEFITKLILSKKEKLVTFHIYGAHAVNDDTLKLLSQCASLKDLTIIRCENLTDDGLMYLENFKNLENLQLWNNSQFSEEALLTILSNKNLVRLHRLSLSRVTNITPAVADMISACYNNLTSLAFYQCPMIVNSDYEHQLRKKFRNIDVVLY